MSTALFLRRASSSAASSASTSARAPLAAYIGYATAPTERLAADGPRHRHHPLLGNRGARLVATDAPAMPPMYTSTHEILRPDTSASPPDGSVVMSVGLTSRAFDLIGDVRHVEQTFRHFVDIRGEIPEGVPLCMLHWEGFKRTASDELYHAQWVNATGDRPLTLPFAAAVVAVNQAAISEAYKTIKADESGWIYKVRARPETMETARKLGLVMSEEQYLAMCDRQEEQEDAEASRSYP